MTPRPRATEGEAANLIRAAPEAGDALARQNMLLDWCVVDRNR